MEDKTKNKSECIGCRSYYLYYSREERKYIITHKVSETFDNEPWISLEDKCVPDLIKLLQSHEIILENNKANLSEQDNKTTKVEEPDPIKNRSYLGKLLDIVQIGAKSIKTP
jgi:hypothetical protein